ncbi:MAG: hypothetical protein ABIG55_00880 [Candidatus Omnitrophota bacterium]
MPDDYEKYLREKELAFEKVCVRCGACCGSLDDPCEKLRKADHGKYYCADYVSRLGPQRTLSGAEFTCVTIRTHIGKGTLRPDCAYRKPL